MLFNLAELSTKAHFRGVWPFSRVPKASPKRLTELEDDLSDVKIALAWCRKAIVELNARMATVTRQAKAAAAAEVSAESAGTDGEADAAVAPPSVHSTAHLARRFRGF